MPVRAARRAGPDDHAPDRSRFGAERDADANLPRLLRHRVRHHAVDADDGERQAQRRKDRQQNDVEARTGVDELVEERFDRPHFGHRLIAIERVDAFDDGARHGRRVARRLHDDTVRGAEQRIRNVDLRQELRP